MANNLPTAQEVLESHLSFSEDGFPIWNILHVLSAMKEFANIHVQNCKKEVSTVQPLLLQKSTYSGTFLPVDILDGVLVTELDGSFKAVPDCDGITKKYPLSLIK